MVDVQTQIVIARPLEMVAGYTFDPDNAPEWYVNINSAEWITPKPLQKGSRIAFKAKFLGRELAYVYEIVEFEPSKRLVMRTHQGPFPMETTYTCENAGNDQTLVKLQNKGNPTGFSRLFAPFMSMMMRKANNKDLQKLREILESK
jgi:uncharacterized membrane protein